MEKSFDTSLLPQVVVISSIKPISSSISLTVLLRATAGKVHSMTALRHVDDLETEVSPLRV